MQAQLLTCSDCPACNGIVVRVSTLQSVDMGFIFVVESYQKILKNGNSQLGAQQRNCVENKPANLLVSLGKTLNEMPPSL